ncbi:hypothetical protein Q3G72_035465 [Acer saccharum]|nr:hypothetical protein Q3G72_035465 [Acer saccharum]
MRLLVERLQPGGVYNLPNASEVAALIVGDLNDTNSNRDVIVDDKSFGLRRISELHPSFMAMQYPLLFQYGEDGFYVGIPYHNNQGKRKTKRNIRTKYMEHEFLRQRAILTPKNDIVDEVNSYVLSEIPGEKITYLSSDLICKASCDVNE